MSSPLEHPVIYTDTGDHKDPENRAAYLLHHMDMVEQHLMEAMGFAWNLSYCLEQTSMSEDVSYMQLGLDEALQTLEKVRLQLGFPSADDEGEGEG